MGVTVSGRRSVTNKEKKEESRVEDVTECVRSYDVCADLPTTRHRREQKFEFLCHRLSRRWYMRR